MVRGPINCLEMTARVKEKIKGVNCLSFLFSYSELQHLQMSAAVLCIFSQFLRTRGNKMDIK